MATNSTIFSMRADVGDLEAQLKKVKETSQKTFNDWNSSAEKVNNAETELIAIKKKQSEAISEVDDEIKKLLATQEKNNKLTKEEAVALERAEEKKKRLIKLYKLQIEAIERNKKALKDETLALKRLHAELNAGVSMANKEIKAKHGQASATNKVTKATSREIAERNKGINTIVRHIRRIESLVVAYYALNSAMNLFVKDGVLLNKSIEDGTIGIGALITANTTLADSFGNQMSAGERFQASMVKSKEVIRDIKTASIETSATFPQLTAVFQQALGKAMGAGDAMGTSVDAIIKNTIDLSKRLTNIAGATGMEMFKVTQEIRAILAGDITKDAEIATMLGITSDDIAEAKKSVNGLSDFLTEKLAVFDVLQNEQSFSKSMARMADAIDTVKMEATKPIFDDLAEGMDDVTKFMKENKDDIVAGYKEIYDTIKTGATFLKENKDIIISLVEAYAIWKTATIGMSVARSASIAIGKKQLLINSALGISTDKNTMSLGRYTKLQLLSTKRALAQASAYRKVGMAFRAIPYAFAITGISMLVGSMMDGSEATDTMAESMAKLNKEMESATGASLEKQIEVQRKILEAQIKSRDLVQSKVGAKESDIKRFGYGAFGGKQVGELSALNAELKKSNKEIKATQDSMQGLTDRLLVLDAGYKAFTSGQLKDAKDGLIETRTSLINLIKEADKAEDAPMLVSLRESLAFIKKELNTIQAQDLKLKAPKREVDEKDLKALEKKRKAYENFWDKFEFDNADAYEKIWIRYERDIEEFAKTEEEKKKLHSRFLKELGVEGDNEAEKEIQRLKKAQEFEKAWLIKRNQLLLEARKSGYTPKQQKDFITAEKKSFFGKDKKEEETLSDILGKSIADGFIDGINSGDFTGMFTGVSSALLQPITKELGGVLGQAFGGKKSEDFSKEALTQGLGGIAINTAVNAISMGIKNAEYEANKPFIDATKAFERSVAEFGIVGEKARTFGFEGQAFTADISGVIAQKNTLQSNLNSATKEYSDELIKTIGTGVFTLGLAELLRDKSILDGLATTMTEARQGYEDYSVGTEIAKVSQGAISFFDGFKGLSDQLTGDDSFKKEKIEKAKKSLSGISEFLDESGGITKASFTKGIVEFSKYGDRLTELNEILGKAKEGSTEYNSALKETQEILGAGTTAQEALDFANSINTVGESFISASGSIDDFTASFQSTIDNQQSFIDTNKALVESAPETVQRLADRFKEEVMQADEARKALDIARQAGDPIGELVERLSKEEADITNIGQMGIDAFTTAYASTDTATAGIQNIIDVVSLRQEDTVSLQALMLDEATASTALLTSIDAQLAEMNTNISALSGINS